MIAKAKYVKGPLCECGYPILLEHVPLGTIYEVETSSIARGAVICGGCGKTNPCHTIKARGGLTYTEGLMPYEIFEIDGPMQ